MRYFCLTHRPLEWTLPAFMEVVSTVPAGEGVTDLSIRYPELAGRGPQLSEYATLFAVRRLLQESWSDGSPPDDAMVGISHYRRFAVTRPTGTPTFIYGGVRPEEFADLPDDVFLPSPVTLLLPAVVNLGHPVVRQYGEVHVTRDLLYFMALAVDLGVVTDRAVSDFLGGNVMVPAATVGVYPAGWLVLLLEALEQVVTVFEQTFAVDRDGYQRRATGFCCERLHALLLATLIGDWPADRVVANRALVVSADATYRGGD
jgi:hypothetical protein